MSTVVLAHAVNAGPRDLWYQDLIDRLTGWGHTVLAPELPDAAAPDPAAWRRVLDSTVTSLDPTDTVLIGHSLGGVALLDLLTRHGTDPRGPYAGAVLVSTMAGPVGYDAVAGFFPEPAFDWPRIRTAARRVRLLVALDDAVLSPDPLEHVRRFATQVGATATVLPTGGHLPNWTPDARPADPLPQAVELVLECLQ
jgi:predicted alpha/beta hydrolase family esterase